jgi:orotate phosphoribosyltransferase
MGAVQALKKAGAKVADCIAIFTYGFPFAKNAFQREKCNIHTLTNLEAMIEVAVLKGILMSADRKMILEFAKNPRN